MEARQAIAAGHFYPGKKEALERKLNEFFKGLPNEKKSPCIIAPHAGYDYSGKTAAYSFNALQESKAFVVLSPNHSGLGPAISISDARFWETPLGRIEVDKRLRERLLEGLGIEADGLAHSGEHSVEVELPFLQTLFKEFKIVPITLMENRLEKLLALGNMLASLGKDFSVVASGDFTHFESFESAKEKDFKAIEKIKGLDVEGFHRLVTENNLSICGLAPITAAMQYCRKKGMKEAKLLHYDTSATETGDKSSVVGYAAIGVY